MSKQVWIGKVLIVVCLLSAGAGHAEEIQAPTRVVRSLEVTDLAIKNSPSLQEALATEAKAQAAVSAAEGLYPYTLQADTGYTHSSSPLGSSLYSKTDTVTSGLELSKTFSVGTSADFRLEGQWYKTDRPASDDTVADEPDDIPMWGLSARFTLTQPLLRGFGNKVGLSTLRQAKKEKTAAQKSADLTASTLAGEALGSYWDLWLAERTVEINIKSRDIAEAQLQETSDRVAAGDAAPVEKLSYQTQVASLEETVIEAEAEVRRLQVVLAEKIGMVDTSLLLVPDTDESPPILEEERSLDALVKQALSESPSIQKAFANVAAAEEKLLVAGESLRQRLDFTAWLEANTLGEDELSPVMTDLGKGGAYSGYVGLVYEVPLDNRQKRGERAQARLSVEIANQQLQSAKNEVVADAANAYNSLAAARKRAVMAGETFRLAEAQAEAERERYRLGAAIFTTVRDAEETVREAELRVAQARVDIVRAQIDLDRLTGALLKRLAVRD